MPSPIWPAPTTPSFLISPACTSAAAAAFPELNARQPAAAGRDTAREIRMANIITCLPWYMHLSKGSQCCPYIDGQSGREKT